MRRHPLTLMGGAETSGDCDPPFANSTATFWRFDTQGLFLGFVAFALLGE